jgi:DNA-binding LacI/PurR family transcriptional regulator
MTVTLKDIAQKADRSVITVSRALAGHSDVAESTRQRVRQTAEEMGYYPNVTARHLQKQRTDKLAFVIPTHDPRFSDPFFSELLAGIGNEAGRHHFDLLVSTQPPDSEDERETYRRIVHGRRANGLEPDRALIVGGDLTQRGGFQAAQTLLALDPRPTAIIACNDLMALGAMSAAQNLGLIIGQDLSVGGFDDIPLAEHAHPPLTTVRQPIYEIGQRVTRMLVQLIQGQLAPETRQDTRRSREAGETPAETQVILTPQLIVRESSGPLIHSA